MNLLQKTINALHWLEDAFLVVIFLVLTALGVAQIVQRNIFESGWIWADGALKVLVLWLALWGASIAGRSGQHMRIELASHYLPLQWRRYSLVLCDIACAVISGVVAYHSTFFVLNERSYGDMAFAQVPVWLCEMIIPLAFALLSQRFFVQAMSLAFSTDKSAENTKA